jgi:predicted PurR-regulated permease PerM
MISPDKREWRLAGIIFFAAIALVLLYATGLILWPFLSPIIIAAIIVVLTFPLYGALRNRLHGRSGLAASIMLAGVTVLLILPTCLLGVLLIQQASLLFHGLQSVEAQQILQRLDLADRLGWLQRLIPGFDPAAVSPQRMILPVVREIPGWVARHGAAVIGGLASVFVSLILILLSSFFFYVEGETILSELEVLSPLPRRYDRQFRSRFKDIIEATFLGQLLCSLAQGVATAVGLGIAGVSGAIFWGAVAAIVALLPVAGAACVWLPASIYLFVDASIHHTSFWRPIFLLLWGFLVVSVVDNVVRPVAMRGKAQLPAIPLLFAVIGGLQAFGFIGLVIGPLVFSLLMSMIDIYKQSFNAEADE